MTLQLTPAEANAKITQIDDAKQQAINVLQSMQDTQQQMLGSSWKGGSATNYGNLSQTQQEDINQIITSLTQICDTATQHIQTVAHLDNS
jgi:WXG100 family type VII secretion target